MTETLVDYRVQAFEALTAAATEGPAAVYESEMALEDNSADAWRETARQFARNARYWRERAECAEARVRCLESERNRAYCDAGDYLTQLRALEAQMRLGSPAQRGN